MSDVQFVNVGLPEMERARGFFLFGKISQGEPRTSTKNDNVFCDVSLNVQTPPFKNREIKYMGRIVWTIWNLTPAKQEILDKYVGQRGVVRVHGLDTEKWSDRDNKERTKVRAQSFSFQHFFDEEMLTLLDLPTGPFGEESGEEVAASTEADTSLD